MRVPWWLPFGKVPELAPAELDGELAGGTPPQLRDVRSRPEFERGHLDGAVNVPIQELPSRLGSLGLDRGRPVVAICLSGHRSVPAVRLLEREGFQGARQLAGGMLAYDAWRRRAEPSRR